MEETGLEREVLDAVQAEMPDLETLLRQRRDYQSAFDKKVSSALQTARANWEREQAEALEQARTQELERARSAAQAEYDARFAALEERSAAQAQRERQVDTADELTRLGLPAGFAPWLTGATADESHARVAEFERTFRDAVRDSVTARMAGAAPAEPVPTPAFDRESLRGMSPGEINAHWAEIQNTLKGGFEPWHLPTLFPRYGPPVCWSTWTTSTSTPPC